METVETLLLDKKDIVIPVKNVLLFAGYRVSSPVPEYAARAKEIAARMHDVFTPRACYLRAPITDRGEDFIDVLGMHLISRPLAELEAPCDEVFLFAATTGPAVDREIKRSAVISPVDNVLTDAAGGAAAEAACDAVDAQLAALIGYPLCQRFSPGYSELSIACQPDFLRLLDTQRKIGLSITAGGMMAPMKSVTAIVGIPREAGTARTLY